MKLPVVGVEQATARCGHAVPFELFEPKKDKFRDGRRKKLTDRDYSACRVKAQAEKGAADQEAARRRRARRAAQPAPEKERLPHGSRFDVAYDAGKEEWSGTLAVPGLAPIAASASAVFKLQRRLDDLYRAAAAEKPDGGGDANRDEGREGCGRADFPCPGPRRPLPSDVAGTPGRERRWPTPKAAPNPVGRRGAPAAGTSAPPAWSSSPSSSGQA